MKRLRLTNNLLLTAVLAAAVCGVQARQVTISNFLLEVSPPSGPGEQSGYFGLQVVDGSVVRYDIAAGQVSLNTVDAVVANSAAVSDQLFFDRFQLPGQDFSGLYNPLFCFDLSGTTAPVGIAARDVNGHEIIENLFLDANLTRAFQSIGFQAPSFGACFYRSYDVDADQFGGFGLFGNELAPSGGLSVQYDVPTSVVVGSSLNYERVISNASGQALTVFYQEVFPANPDFFASASFPASEAQVRDSINVPAGQAVSSGPVSRNVTLENAVPGEYLDLYFAVAALDGNGSLLTAAEHRRVLVTAADAGQSEISATPRTGLVADGSAAATISVTVRDPELTLVEGQEVTLAVAGGNAGTGGLSSTSVMSGSNGVAEATLTSTRAETITVSAHLGSSIAGPLIGTVEVTFVPGAAAALSFSGSVADLSSGTARALTLEVVDANGNLVSSDSGRTIAFQQSGAGTVTGLGDVTTQSGLASVTVTGNLAGLVTIIATTAGLADDSTGFAVVPGQATQLVFVSAESDLASSTQRALTVQLQDAQGNQIVVDPGSEVTFSQLGGAGTLEGLGSTTSSGGLAVLSVTGTTAGSVEVQAAGPGLTPDTTSFAVIPGAATKLVFSSNEDPVPVGQFKTLVIEIYDANDNRVTSDTRTIGLAKVLGSGSGVVDPMNGPVLISNGVVNLPVEGVTAGPLTLNAAVLPGDLNPIAPVNTAFSVTDP